MNNKIIIVTGGAGFVGGNLIEKLLRDTKYKIIAGRSNIGTYLVTRALSIILEDCSITMQSNKVAQNHMFMIECYSIASNC